MAKTTTTSKSSLPLRTAAQVYSQTAKTGNGKVGKGSFGAKVASLAAQHMPPASKRK